MSQETFHNLDPKVRPKFSKVFQWSVVDKVMGRRRQSPAHSPVEYVESPVISGLEKPGAVWLGHATMLLTVDGRRVLTDPVFAPRLGGFIKRNVPVVMGAQGLPQIDVVLISHNHRDHLDKPSVMAVDARFSPRYVVPVGVDRYLRAWGVPAQMIQTLEWWGSCAPEPGLSALKVSLVPAQHWSQRTPFDRNTSLWGGFVLEGREHRVYFAGDSGYFDGFKMIGERFPNLDLACLPIGAYDPEWFMSPQHMNPEEAGRALLDVGAARMVSIHWGTYKLTDEPLDEPPVRLDAWRREAGVSAERVVTLPAGGELLL